MWKLIFKSITGALLKSNDQQEEIIICGGIDLTTDKERETMKKESGKKTFMYYSRTAAMRSAFTKVR